MKYLVTGGTSGIGAAVVDELESKGHEVTTLSKDPSADIEMDLTRVIDEGFLDKQNQFDLQIHGIIHCAGVNLLKPHHQLHDLDMVTLFRVNALATFFLNRYYRPNISCSIVSDAAWTPMTHSLAYNVSKAAQHMVVRQMAHEDRDRIIFGVAPGKVSDTGMSQYIDNTFPPMRGMTYEQGREYQLKGLRTGEMAPCVVAEFIVDLVTKPSPHFNGHIFPIGG